MKKKISVLIISALVIAMIPQISLGATADTWDGSADTSWYNAIDTEFTINTAEELAGLAKLVNDETDDFEGKTVKLARDIDLSGHEWVPIGYFEIGVPHIQVGFLGTFDGQLSEIKNMTMTSASTVSGVGLFGSPTDGYSKGAVLKNIIMTDVSINIQSGSNVAIYVGGIAGQMIGGVISNCHVTGDIIGQGEVGGIAGVSIACSIENSSSITNVTSIMSTAGGITGLYTQDVIISNSYSIGKITGAYAQAGIVGASFHGGKGCQIINSYSACEMNIPVKPLMGGLIGAQQDAIINNSYGNSDTVLSAEGSNGSEYNGKPGATYDEMKTAEFLAQLGDEFAQDPDINGGLPYLKSQIKEEEVVTPPPTPTPEEPSAPATGDNTNVILYMVMVLIAISGSGYMALRRNKV